LGVHFEIKIGFPGFEPLGPESVQKRLEKGHAKTEKRKEEKAKQKGEGGPNGKNLANPLSRPGHSQKTVNSQPRTEGTASEDVLEKGVGRI